MKNKILKPSEIKEGMILEGRGTRYLVKNFDGVLIGVQEHLDWNDLDNSKIWINSLSDYFNPKNTDVSIENIYAPSTSKNPYEIDESRKIWNDDIFYYQKQIMDLESKRNNLYYSYGQKNKNRKHNLNRADWIYQDKKNTLQYTKTLSYTIRELKDVLWCLQFNHQKYIRRYGV